MRADWKRLIKGADFKRKKSGVLVLLANGRKHFVRVSEGAEGFLLEATVATSRELEAHGDPLVAAWARNRRSRLVGYRIDRQGRLVAHSWSPAEGVTKETFELLIKAVAREADRQEFLLTSTDRR